MTGGNLLRVSNVERWSFLLKQDFPKILRHMHVVCSAAVFLLTVDYGIPSTVQLWPQEVMVDPFKGVQWETSRETATELGTK